MRYSILSLLIGIGVPWQGAAQETLPGSGEPTAVHGGPLFESHATLRLTLRAPFARLFADRGDDAPGYDGSLSYVDPSGAVVSIEIDLALRGRNRRLSRTCSFPPMRLDFPTDRIDGTVFAGQDGLKLVTQCREDRDEYRRYVVLEFLSYRAYNLLTDLSYRVRLAEITYEDIDGRREPITRLAFFVEDHDAMAARHGWTVLRIPRLSPSLLDPRQLALDEMFQYMIGHTDFEAFVGETGEYTCCHNGRLIGTMEGPVVPVPYDFDFAGLVNARYARAIEGQRNVRQRLYRGVCRDRQILDETRAQFRERRAAIEALFHETDLLNDRAREQAVAYIADFYEAIEDPRTVDREFVQGCRNIP